MRQYTFKHKTSDLVVRGYGNDALAALRAAGFVWGCSIEPPFDRLGNWDVAEVSAVCRCCSSYLFNLSLGEPCPTCGTEVE